MTIAVRTAKVPTRIPSAQQTSKRVSKLPAFKANGSILSDGNPLVQRQPACVCDGGCPRCLPVQTKLTIGQPNDRYEREADRVADLVMRMPEPRIQRQVELEQEEKETIQTKPIASQIAPIIQRQVGPGEEEEQGLVQAKPPLQRQAEREEEKETLQSKPLFGQIAPMIQRQVEPEEEEQEEEQPVEEEEGEEPIQTKLAEGAKVQRQEAEPEQEEEEEPIQSKRSRGQSPRAGPRVAAQIRALRGKGEPLSPSVRNFFEPRFGYDFSQVRVHNDARMARALDARAFTSGQHVVFGAAQYAPETAVGRRLLAHELTHVIQQTSAIGHMIQAFTAELDGNRVYVKPEKNDTDADLDQILFGRMKRRRIAGRKKIDVTDCLPAATIKAMSLGPYNCAEFVRLALGKTRPKGELEARWLLTPKLWDELLKKGYRVRGFGIVKRDGKIEAVEKLTWGQLNPRMGDLVFMRGEVLLKKGAKEPDPAGDNFRVTWDHVGFFIVRSRGGFDYHLAKDGDENPIDVYHTGSARTENVAPGAYVKGVASLLAYVGLPELEKKTETETR